MTLSLRPVPWWRPPLGLMLFVLGALLMGEATHAAYALGYTAATREVRAHLAQCWGPRVLPPRSP